MPPDSKFETSRAKIRESLRDTAKQMSRYVLAGNSAGIAASLALFTKADIGKAAFIPLSFFLAGALCVGLSHFMAFARLALTTGLVGKPHQPFSSGLARMVRPEVIDEAIRSAIRLLSFFPLLDLVSIFFLLIGIVSGYIVALAA